nr:transporter substrate-binding domain-containing protein [Kocuria atrinae]
MAHPRRFTSLSAALLALFTLIAVNLPGAVASPLTVPQETAGDSGETYVIATDTTFAPFEFRDSSGELTGIDIKIMEAIAEDQASRWNGVPLDSTPHCKR